MTSYDMAHMQKTTPGMRHMLFAASALVLLLEFRSSCSRRTPRSISHGQLS